MRLLMGLVVIFTLIIFLVMVAVAGPENVFDGW